MTARVCFTVIVLLSMISCDNKVEELQEQKKAAEQELQATKQMQQKAEEVVQEKANFRQSRAPLDPNKQVELLGSVAVWGRQPGTKGSAQGIIVQLFNKDKQKSYTAFVDSDNKFKLTVTPGKYSLTINQPGYELHQEEITIDGKLNSQLLRPIGLKNIK